MARQPASAALRGNRFPVQLYCGGRPYCAGACDDLSAEPSFSGDKMADADPKLAAPSLDAVRARLDEIDAALLALVD